MLPFRSFSLKLKTYCGGTVTESAQLHPARSIPRVHYGKYQQSARISACTENAGAEGFSNGPNPVDPTRPAAGFFSTFFSPFFHGADPLEQALQDAVLRPAGRCFPTPCAPTQLQGLFFLGHDEYPQARPGPPLLPRRPTTTPAPRPLNLEAK